MKTVATDARPPPSFWLRRGLAVAVVAGLIYALTLVIGLAEATLALWQQLQQLPLWITTLFGVFAAGLVAGSGWVIWRLLRAPQPRDVAVAEVNRPKIEQRIGALATAAPSAAGVLSAELEELDRRRAAEIVQIALFGEISAGKSSLRNALCGDASGDVDVTGGTTRRIEHASARLPDGRCLQLADVPGVNEPDGEARAHLARDEAARAHALVFVADGDLTRSQDGELRALLASARPLLLALNKSDRYTDSERAALLAHLRRRYPPPQVEVVAISAGHQEQVWREYPDGRREQVMRAQPPQIEALLQALARIVRRGADVLEPARAVATLQRLDQRIDEVERAGMEAAAEACVARYTRRAVVGALAAVAPGTDLLIQGALATAMLRELCALHTLRLDDIDLDDLVRRAAGTVRGSTAITLAIAGNALKAFPGVGTLGGGVVHALAYGLIFDALGHAVAQTLRETHRLDREASLRHFSERLSAAGGERLRAIAGMAWDAARAQIDTASTRQASASDHAH